MERIQNVIYKILPSLHETNGFHFLVFITLSGISQKKAAYVSGKVIDENENPLPGVSITHIRKTKWNSYF